jgi:hypothetical protein
MVDRSAPSNAAEHAWPSVSRSDGSASAPAVTTHRATSLSAFSHPVKRERRHRQRHVRALRGALQRAGVGTAWSVLVDYGVGGRIGLRIRISGTGAPPVESVTCSIGTNPAASYSG